MINPPMTAIQTTSELTTFQLTFLVTVGSRNVEQHKSKIPPAVINAPKIKITIGNSFYPKNDKTKPNTI